MDAELGRRSDELRAEAATRLRAAYDEERERIAVQREWERAHPWRIRIRGFGRWLAGVGKWVAGTLVLVIVLGGFSYWRTGAGGISGNDGLRVQIVGMNRDMKTLVDAYNAHADTTVAYQAVLMRLDRVAAVGNLSANIATLRDGAVAKTRKLMPELDSCARLTLSCQQGRDDLVTASDAWDDLIAAVKKP